MKNLFFILFINLFFLNFIKGQENDSLFRKIETGNGLELSFLPVNDNGDIVSFNCLEEYPESALKDSVCGRVFTQFTINKEGKVVDVKTIRGVRNDLDSACIRVIRKLPNWSKPKSHNNTNINVRFILPIKFIIQKK